MLHSDLRGLVLLALAACAAAFSAAGTIMPCEAGFWPTCEQARGFKLCGRADVLAVCSETCSFAGDTSGHSLHEENKASQPSDYTTPLPAGSAAIDICAACAETPEQKCCHNHPHAARKRQLDHGNECEIIPPAKTPCKDRIYKGKPLSKTYRKVGKGYCRSYVAEEIHPYNFDRVCVTSQKECEESCSGYSDPVGGCNGIAFGEEESGYCDGKPVCYQYWTKFTGPSWSWTATAPPPQAGSGTAGLSCRVRGDAVCAWNQGETCTGDFDTDCNPATTDRDYWQRGRTDQEYAWDTDWTT